MQSEQLAVRWFGVNSRLDASLYAIHTTARLPCSSHQHKGEAGASHRTDVHQPTHSDVTSFRGGDGVHESTGGVDVARPAVRRAMDA